jgi:hypothetical protein
MKTRQPKNLAKSTLQSNTVSEDIDGEHLESEDSLNLVYCDGILNMICDHPSYI